MASSRLLRRGTGGTCTALLDVATVTGHSHTLERFGTDKTHMEKLSLLHFFHFHGHFHGYFRRHKSNFQQHQLLADNGPCCTAQLLHCLAKSSTLGWEFKHLTEILYLKRDKNTNLNYTSYPCIYYFSMIDIKMENHVSLSGMQDCAICNAVRISNTSRMSFTAPDRSRCTRIIFF